MRSLNILKSRLSNENTLKVQNENGFYETVGFKWNRSATDMEIEEFEIVNQIRLPKSYKEFLKISNGAILFKDEKYGQWGCKILGLSELANTTEQVANWGYEIKESWLVFATWMGDLDLLLFDINKCTLNESNFIIDGEQGETVANWKTINGDFSKWLDRLIVSQGSKYWRWY